MTELRERRNSGSSSEILRLFPQSPFRLFRNNLAWLGSCIPPDASQYPEVWAVRVAACGISWEMCINLVHAEGTGRMQLPTGPRAASRHGNQQRAKPRNEFKLTCIHVALFQGGNIPLGTVQGLVRTRGAAWMRGLPSVKNIVTYVEMEPTLTVTSVPSAFTYSTALQKAHLFPYVMPSVPQ